MTMIKHEITNQKLIDDVQICEYAMKNECLEVRFLNIGGAITKISMQPDNFNENLVLTYDNFESYFNNKCYLNALVGRTSNRIKDGQFLLNDKIIQVDLNDGPNNLHGGHENLSHTLLDVKPISNGYQLTATLPHQKAGFPGNLFITVFYQLEDNRLKVSYEATTDQDTIVNLTQHTYFNLSGNLKSSIYNHQLQIKADVVAEVDENSSFTKKELPVANTLFDFNVPRIIDPQGMEVPPLFKNTAGYDHLYLLRTNHEAVIFKDPISGRTLKISTTAPAVQFYAGNYLTSELLFEHNRPGETHLGACFETHLIPYDFQSQVLKSGDKYQQETIFEFTKYAIPYPSLLPLNEKFIFLK